MLSSNAFPMSIGIAGFNGYIGGKVMQAALDAGVNVFGFDPFARNLSPQKNFTSVEDEMIFYCGIVPELYHLALHPDTRSRAQELLFSRATTMPIAILMEKPMAAPEDPQSCQRLIDAIDRSKALVLFDFPELFDPLTAKIISYLRQFESLQIDEIFLQRSKDRECDNPRNRKKIVPIQFQESVHCLAFFLFLLGSLRGTYDAALKDGIIVQAASIPYAPPNPEDYQHVVDGRCEYKLRCGKTQIRGITDFTRGAESTKRRIIHGVGDGVPFAIEVDYFEGAKYLRINGVDQGFAKDGCSYSSILSTFFRWQQTVPREKLHSGMYPHSHFAQLTYALSGMLWRSSHEQKQSAVENVDELRHFDSGFAAALPNLPKY